MDIMIQFMHQCHWSLRSFFFHIVDAKEKKRAFKRIYSIRSLFSSESTTIQKMPHVSETIIFAKVLVIGFLVRWNWVRSAQAVRPETAKMAAEAAGTVSCPGLGQVMPSLYQARKVLRNKLWFDLWIQIWPVQSGLLTTRKCWESEKLGGRKWQN